MAWMNDQQCKCSFSASLFFYTQFGFSAVVACWICLSKWWFGMVGGQSIAYRWQITLLRVWYLVGRFRCFQVTAWAIRLKMVCLHVVVFVVSSFRPDCGPHFTRTCPRTSCSPNQLYQGLDHHWWQSWIPVLLPFSLVRLERFQDHIF